MTDIRDRHQNLLITINARQTAPITEIDNFKDMKDAIDKVFSSDTEEVFDQRLEAYKWLIEEVQAERMRQGMGTILGRHLG